MVGKKKKKVKRVKAPKRISAKKHARKTNKTNKKNIRQADRDYDKRYKAETKELLRKKDTKKVKGKTPTMTEAYKKRARSMYFKKQ